MFWSDFCFHYCLCVSTLKARRQIFPPQHLKASRPRRWYGGLVSSTSGSREAPLPHYFSKSCSFRAILSKFWAQGPLTKILDPPLWLCAWNSRILGSVARESYRGGSGWRVGRGGGFNPFHLWLHIFVAIEKELKSNFLYLQLPRWEDFLLGKPSLISLRMSAMAAVFPRGTPTKAGPPETRIHAQNDQLDRESHFWHRHTLKFLRKQKNKTKKKN